jgi:hypothetical protein
MTIYELWVWMLNQHAAWLVVMPIAVVANIVIKVQLFGRTNRNNTDRLCRAIGYRTTSIHDDMPSPTVSGQVL